MSKIEQIPVSANTRLSFPGNAINFLRARWREIAIPLLIFAPVLALVYNALSWLRYGIDLPLWDDWGLYNPGGIGSFKLGYLFFPANNTLYPVGKALDSVAQHLLDGNSVAYQLVSMITVLGLLLFLQWRLLLLCLKDRILAASAFGLTLMMLRPDSYWGFQNLAYHHAIPLVCNLAAIYLVLGKTSKSRWSIPALFALGAVSGMSYISGAFSTLVTGMVIFISGLFILPSERKPLIRGGLAVALAGFITVLVQLWFTAPVEKGIYTPGVSMALPIEKEFWLFMFGVIGKSLFLSGRYPVFHFLVAAFFFAAAGVLIFRYARRLAKAKGESRTVPEAVTGIVLAAVFGGIFVYLMLVSAGRTHLRPPEIDSAFTYGFSRFHFFWVTLLWPWVAAACFDFLRDRTFPGGRRNPSHYLALALILITALLLAGVFTKGSYYRQGAFSRSMGLTCIISSLHNGEAVNCPELYPTDLYRSVIYAKGINASFTRNIPPVFVPFGTENPPPLYRLTKAAPLKLEVENMADARTTESGYRFRAADDPRITIKTGSPDVLRHCLAVQVTALLRAGESDTAQVFYKAPDQKRFKEKFSRIAPVRPDGDNFQEISFELACATGFLDDFRFNPVKKPQEFEIKDIEIRCRVSR